MANERFAFLPWQDTEAAIVAAIHPGEAAIATDTGRWIVKRRDTGEIVTFGGSASFTQKFSAVTLNSLPALSSPATGTMRCIVEGVEVGAGFSVVGQVPTWVAGTVGYSLVPGMKGTYVFGNGAALSPDGQLASAADGYAVRAELAAAAAAALNVAPTGSTKGLARFATNGEIGAGALANVLVQPSGLATKNIDYSSDDEFAAALLASMRNGMLGNLNAQGLPDGIMYTFGAVDFLDPVLTSPAANVYDPVAFNQQGNFVSNAPVTTGASGLWTGVGTGWTFTGAGITNAAASATAIRFGNQWSGDFAFNFTLNSTGAGKTQLTLVPNADDGSYSNSAADAGYPPGSAIASLRIVIDTVGPSIKFYAAGATTPEYTYTGAITGAYELRRIDNRVVLLRAGVGVGEFSTTLSGAVRLSVSKESGVSFDWSLTSTRFHTSAIAADIVSNQTAMWNSTSLVSLAVVVQGETSDPTIGTEVTGFVSHDNGGTWLPVTLTGEVRGCGTNTRFCRGSVSLGGLRSNLRWKLSLSAAQIIKVMAVTISEDY